MNSPNILILVADELRYDCLGYAGNKVVRTPHIDRLAAGGVGVLIMPTPRRRFVFQRGNVLRLAISQELGAKAGLICSGLPHFPESLVASGIKVCRAENASFGPRSITGLAGPAIW